MLYACPTATWNVIGWISRTRNSQPPKHPSGWILNSGSFQKDIYSFSFTDASSFSTAPGYLLKFLLSANQDHMRFTQVGHFSSLEKLTSWKCYKLSQKAPFISSSVRFQVETNFVFSEIIFYWKSIPAAPTSSSNEKKNTQKGLGGYFEARHHGFNFINLRKTIQHGPLSSKSVGMRMAWGLRWGAGFSKKRMVAKEKNMSNKQTKATKVKHNHFWRVGSSGHEKPWQPKKFPNSKEIKACALLDGKKKLSNTSLKTSPFGS